MITSKTMQLTFRFLSTGFVAVILHGCYAPGPGNVPTDPDCAETVSTRCILELAESSLASISVDKDWVAGGLEIATALQADKQIEKSRHYLDQALIRASGIPDVAERTTALAQIAKVYSELYSAEATRKVAGLGETLLAEIDDANKRQDLLGQLLAARAAIGDADAALHSAHEMSEADATLASYKARTLHEIAPLQAKTGDFAAATETLAQIDMGLSYYQATSRADVAKLAAAEGHSELAKNQLVAAAAIARAQTDGYFIAGALRHVGEAWATMNDEPAALGYFAEAVAGARTAAAQQQKARALSRVATGLADFGYYERAGIVVDEALGIAATEEADLLRYWSFYEITGTAAFAGDFAVALETLERIPADTSLTGVSLRNVTRRDIAWGLARHKELGKALALTQAIDSARERVQSLSRIVRVMRDPEMQALPRYL